jgi:hypothetical protein
VLLVGLGLLPRLTLRDSLRYLPFRRGLRLVDLGETVRRTSEYGERVCGLPLESDLPLDGDLDLEGEGIMRFVEIVDGYEIVQRVDLRVAILANSLDRLYFGCL